MNIYDKDTQSFDNNGLGFLINTISANVTEGLNGDLYLELNHPLNSAMSQYLVDENIIRCNTGNANNQLFRIKRVIKTDTQINIFATHITYDLNDNFLLDTAPTNQNANSFGNWILNHTEYATNFTFYSDITGTKSARYVRRNPTEAIMGDLDNSMINLFGGDIERDNFIIKLLAYRGNQNPIKLIFGKNIKEIQITKDTSSVITKVLPLGYDALMLPEIYVNSPLMGANPKIAKIEFSDIKYDPEDEEAYHTLEEAYQALRDATNELFSQGLDKPSINAKINWLELSKTEEYKQYSSLEKIHLGDSITAEIYGLDFNTRVIKTIYNVLTDTIESFEIGTITGTITNSVNQNTKSVEKINPSSILEDARNNATQQITQAMGGYIFKTQSELYIMDSNDPLTAQKIWRWNLNGLAYSDNGINGDYSIAMTQDGQIVADFITTGQMNTDVIEGLNELIVRINTNIDEFGNITEVTTTNGFTFNNKGLNIYNGDDAFNTLIDNKGTYYKDGDRTLSKTTKDGTVTKDFVLYGKYYYGVKEDVNIDEFTKDDAMFVCEFYTDNNNEEAFGHFYNQ